VLKAVRRKCFGLAKEREYDECRSTVKAHQKEFKRIVQELLAIRTEVAC
jgi:hypothetical protein